MRKKPIVNAIGLHCRECQIPVGCTHAYIENGTLYIQGQCSECGEGIRFSCDSLLANLMGNESHKGNGSVN